MKEIVLSILLRSINGVMDLSFMKRDDIHNISDKDLIKGVLVCP